MHRVTLLCRGLAFALLVAVAGCSPGKGRGLLVLNLSADAAVPAGAANKVVLVFPGVPDRTYAGPFPLANHAPLLLEFPNLPAGQVTIIVRAFAADGCLVAEASRPVTVNGGAKTSADVVLAAASSPCADGGGTPVDVGGLDTSGEQRNVDAPLGETSLPVDTPPADTGRMDAPGEAGFGPGDAMDTPMGAGGAGGSDGPGTGGTAGGGTTGSGGIATGGAPGTGGAAGSGGGPGTGGGIGMDASRDIGAAGSTGGRGTGGAGTSGAGAGGSGTGGSGTGGSGTGGSGTGGSGTGGSGTGGSGTGGSGTGGTTACQTGLVTASQVVIMGESFYAIEPRYIATRLEADARNAGAIGPYDAYRNVAVSGQTLNSIATTEWTSAVSGGTVKVVIMDGGAIDCMSSSCPSCPDTFQTFLGKLATYGVQDVIYTRMPEPGDPPGSNLTLKSNFDILFPKMEVVCAAATGLRCHWVDLRPVWKDGDVLLDGLHPSQSGGDHVGDAIWAEMVKDCIAQ